MCVTFSKSQTHLWTRKWWKNPRLGIKRGALSADTLYLECAWPGAEPSQRLYHFYYLSRNCLNRNFWGIMTSHKEQTCIFKLCKHALLHNETGLSCWECQRSGALTPNHMLMTCMKQKIDRFRQEKSITAVGRLVIIQTYFSKCERHQNKKHHFESFGLCHSTELSSSKLWHGLRFSLSGGHATDPATVKACCWSSRTS